MTIDNWYPNPEEIVRCEIKTLKYLQGNKFLWQEMEQLANAAHGNYSYYANDFQLKRAQI